VTEKEQRWGAKTVEGSGHVESVRYLSDREEGVKDTKEECDNSVFRYKREGRGCI